MPEHDDDAVTIYSTDNQVEVALIKMWLDSAGIDHIVVNEAVSSLYPIAALSWVRFQVLSRDAAKAAEVLRTHGFK